MLLFPPDQNDEARLAALNSYNILDTGEEKDFDDLTDLASAICRTPIALISLIDDKRQWFKSHKGLTDKESLISIPIPALTVTSIDDIVIVEDLRKDERFAEAQLLQSEHKIAFYAGVPLINADGFILGSLSVIDKKKKKLSIEQANALKIIARQVVDKLELRKKALEMERMYQELTDSNLFIQKFAVMAAHDLKNPLSSILLTAQALKGRLAKLEDKSFGNLIDMNITSTKRLIDLIDSMLAYSQSPALLLTQKQTIKLKELLLLIIGMIHVPDNFNIILPTENETLTISTITLQQVLINLLTNAIRYNDKHKGIILIRFRQDNENYYFEVEDNGIGIAEQYYEKIFSTNFTLKITDRYNKKGSGIGLSTVKELIRAVKGKISVQSIVGQSTIFSITLPKNSN
jgi:signal transduction histidine kinase